MTILTILTIARLTIRETQRRRILWVGLLMGLAFLTFFGLGLHFILGEMEREAGQRLTPGEAALPLTFFAIAGLYATNFLVIMISVLTSVATISGEVESHTVDSLLTKPISRWEVIAGKWLAFALLIAAFVLLLPGGVLAVVYLRAGFTLSNVPVALGLIYLEGLVGLSVTIAGGTRLSTLANGAMALMLFGLAFIGGWVEQIGALLSNETAVDLGITASLLMPTEALWRKAAAVLEPELATGMDFAGPFATISQPSNAMIVYAVLYLALFLGLSIWSFSRRDL
jgi:ABC-type transport system involved in multi-copper enzyme maturation permease subunit